MRRGTTPTITVSVKGCDLKNYTDIHIVLYQSGVNIVKTFSHKDVKEEGIIFTLTQEETLSLASGMVSIQMRAVDAFGAAIASDIHTEKVDRILEEGVI